MTRDQKDLLALMGYFYLRNARPDRAEAVLAALAALDPADERAALSLACAQVRCGKAEPALQGLDRMLERGSIGATVHLLRGQALAQLGREAESTRALQAYLTARAAEAPAP